MSSAETFAFALEEKFNKENAVKGARFTYTFEVEAGKKFDRIVQFQTWERDTVNNHKPQRSVHAFVERATGDLIKAAGWKAPAKIKTGWATKFNLNTEFEKALAEADPYGGYLYQR